MLQRFFVLWFIGCGWAVHAGDTASPERGSDSFSFVVFGDLNGGGCDRNDRVTRLVAEMAAEPDVAFFVGTGDFIDGYASGDGSNICFGVDPVSRNVGEACPGDTPDGNVSAMLGPIKDRTPQSGLVASFYPVIGNHDDNWGSGWYPDPCQGGICDLLAPNDPEDFLNHDHGDICTMDQGQSAHSSHFYYSFGYRNSLFIVLRQNNDYFGMLSCNGHPGYPDCGSYCSDESLRDDPQRNGYCYAVQQFDWLRAELQQAQGVYEHIFVFAHAPLLNSGTGHGPTSGAVHIRGLLEEYGVKFFFNGHNHAYERTYPVNGQDVDRNGVTYVTVGTAGGLSDGVNGDWFTAATYQNWTHYGDSGYHDKMTTYLKMTVTDDAIQGDVYSLGMDQVVDSFAWTSSFQEMAARWRESLPHGSAEDTNGNGVLDVADLVALINGDVVPGDDGPTLAGCPVLPADNWWNTPIDETPLHPNSAAYIAHVGPDTYLHPDFGTVWQGIGIGIPYNVVPNDQPQQFVTFRWPEESDPGPYPIPDEPIIEGGSDHHMLIMRQDACLLYEMFDVAQNQDGTWTAGSGAIWDMSQNQVRPQGWTSADAAGLPILPGLVRYDEVHELGEINHALRVTFSQIQRGYILPATHSDGQAGNDPNAPPMGLRLRLRADFDISGFDEPIQVILRALKKYGLFVADTGANLFLSGVHDMRWDDDQLRQLRQVKMSDFEAVYTGDVIPY
ncbi:Metallophosphoesterase [Sulfidibacter corallicola]|uniref:Metallophosphoesterase n=1 Tax=Sulfidibacter corallicola TaxID=2818388 RepID=A0A8A4TPH3_SULCO|nr:metallophosphoesterase [Sulfidibacter corallicola]QTD51869.1 metallophosphoesterase [Sulfidibacter corallicola]